MRYLLIVGCVAFVFISGRNDGSPLIAMPLQTVRRLWWVPVCLLWVLLPLVPVLGLWAVADSLEDLFIQTSGIGGAVVVIFTVLLVVGVATAKAIPTSITLALVGALTGVSLATGVGVDAPLLGRVIILGIASPFIAAVLGWALSQLPPAIPKAGASYRTLATYRTVTFPALVAAYALNDGQKVLFCVALVAGSSVAEAASMVPLLIGASTVFCLGAISGLSASGRFVRHGITAASPTRLLWAEAATAMTVVGGSAAGIPLSMTQSLTGALVGSGVARSRRAVYWRSISKVGIAWLWTMPVAILVSYGGASLI